MMSQLIQQQQNTSKELEETKQILAHTVEKIKIGMIHFNSDAYYT